MSNESPTPDQFAELRQAIRTGEKEQVKNAVEQLEQNGVSKEGIPADLQEHIDALLNAPETDVAEPQGAEGSNDAALEAGETKDTPAQAAE
jgi:glutamyl-tRNA reductase